MFVSSRPRPRLGAALALGLLALASPATAQLRLGFDEADIRREAFHASQRLEGIVEHLLLGEHYGMALRALERARAAGRARWGEELRDRSLLSPAEARESRHHLLDTAAAEMRAEMIAALRAGPPGDWGWVGPWWKVRDEVVGVDRRGVLASVVGGFRRYSAVDRARIEDLELRVGEATSRGVFEDSLEVGREQLTASITPWVIRALETGEPLSEGLVEKLVLAARWVSAEQARERLVALLEGMGLPVPAYLSESLLPWLVDGPPVEESDDAGAELAPGAPAEDGVGLLGFGDGPDA